MERNHTAKYTIGKGKTMATRKICVKCKGVHSESGQYCQQCRAQVDSDRAKWADAHRPPAHERGYGYKWRQASQSFLRHYPRCNACGAAATVVDHVVPHRGDMQLFWDKGNWQPLCASCHGRKTVEHDGGFGKRG